MLIDRVKKKVGSWRLDRSYARKEYADPVYARKACENVGKGIGAPALAVSCSTFLEKYKVERRKLPRSR
jgi:hypothetical protein